MLASHGHCLQRRWVLELTVIVCFSFERRGVTWDADAHLAKLLASIGADLLFTQDGVLGNVGLTLRVHDGLLGCLYRRCFVYVHRVHHFGWVARPTAWCRSLAFDLNAAALLVVLGPRAFYALIRIILHRSLCNCAILT